MKNQLKLNYRKMNNMFLVIALAILSFNTAQAQDFKMNVGNKNGNLSIALFDSKLQITGYSGSELTITAKGYKKPPERAQGLKPLYNAAVDNTNIGLSVTESGGDIKIEKATREDVDYVIKVPQNMSVSITETNWHGDGFKLDNISGEIEVNAKSSDIEITNAAGPIVANTTNGNINVIYKSLNQEKPNSIKSINGYVDITLPPSAKGAIKMRSMNGEIFTNFEIALKTAEDQTTRIGGGGKIEGSINGGGVEMDLNTINDNIYLRKAE
jgi:hypothetical protein